MTYFPGYFRVVVSKSFNLLGGYMAKVAFNYDYHALRKLIIFKYGNIGLFASEILNITPTYFSRILSGKVEYSQSSITKTVDALEISSEMIGFYFFTQECQKVSKSL